MGWLQFLHRKSTMPDDWSPDGEPHEWWDRTSTDPMCSFPRFDLQESAYAIGLMADRTPAWCEVYAEILNGLCERYLTYWAAVDWLSQFGADPRRKTYPPEWKGTLIPEQFWGEYDTPGWVANGIEPWGLQPDPIGADGNLFFKGWLNLTQALHAYVTGEDRWGTSFQVAGVGRSSFEWTQHRLVEHLAAQWSRVPMGPHCENTKVWPFCLSAAGLGLQMYDNLFGGNTHDVYSAWREHTEDKYYGFASSGELEWVAMYYDPLKEHVHATMPVLGLAISFYALPQAPEFAERLYRAAVAFMHWDDPTSPIVALPDPRTMLLGLAMAREMGDYVTEARLRAYAEKHFEPRYFGDGEAQFGFWFHFGENWPRGQLSALAMCAEVGEPGDWQRLFRNPNLAKFSEPVVQGVEYPAVGVAQAWNDPQTATLHLQLLDGNGSRSGQPTRFSIARLPDASKVQVLCDGKVTEDWQQTAPDTIEIATCVGSHAFQIHTGYRADAGGQSRLIRAAEGIAQQPSRAGVGAASAESARPQVQQSRIIAPVRQMCSCCAAF